MNRLKFTKIFLVVLVMCFSTNIILAESYSQKCVNTWIGFPIDDVITHNSFPTSEKKMVGRHVVRWDKKDRRYVGELGYITYICNRVFEIDENRIIVSAFSEGKACPKYYPLGKSWINPQNNPWKK